MKNPYILLILCILACVPFSDYSQSVSQPNDSIRNQLYSDSVYHQAQMDSLLYAYNFIIQRMRSQNESLEIDLIKKNRTIAVLIIVMVLSILIFLRILTRKMIYSSFPVYRQRKGEQPGFVCLKMMYQYYYGKKLPYKKIATAVPVNDVQSITLDDIVSTAKQLDFEVKVVKVGLQQLLSEVQYPVILYMPNHMTVLFTSKNDDFYLSDPYYGQIRIKSYYFATSWFVDDKNMEGIAIMLFPVKQVRKSLIHSVHLEKFKKIAGFDKRNWKNYTCELVVE